MRFLIWRAFLAGFMANMAVHAALHGLLLEACVSVALAALVMLFVAVDARDFSERGA